MYRKFKKRGNAQRGLNAIDENTTIKIPRVSSSVAKPDDDTIESFVGGSEEENIPASQEQTQRFLSQHSIALAATLGRTQSSSRINSSRQPNTFFEMVLLNAGVQLDNADTFVLSCDHIAIVSKLRDILTRSPKYPENIETFKTGLNAALAPKSKIAEKLLSGCTIDTAGEDQAYQSQNSMFINFLMIDFLREPCLEVLFNKIEEIAKMNRVQAQPSSLPLLPLMLVQLRYLTLSHSDQIYNHIERIFNNASEAAKLDIINSAEFVLDGSKHDEFVELLFINYANSKDLFHLATVQMLGNLTLSARIQGKLRSRILEFIKQDNSCSHSLLPHLIRLLLNCLNQDTDDIVRELVSTLREIFYLCQMSESSAQFVSLSINNDKQSQLELFGFLQQGLKRSKKFFQMWQRTISGLPAGEFRSFDFIMLILLVHINEDNTLYIENLLRRRIKLEHITVDILEEVKTHFPYILEQHIGILMHILHDFMREKNRIVSDFAKSAYSILFQICNSIQKSILKKLLELTFDKSAPHVTTMSLILLRDLQRKNSKYVQNCALLLMPLLDRLSDFTLPQTRLSMDLLCHVAFPDPKLTECAPLQDQIEMIVKKQQINRIEYVKRQGIIGCVQLIDAVARIETILMENDDLQTSVDSITSLPDGRSKQAANLIMLTQSAISNSPELLALFYDELASVLTVRYYNAESPYMLDNKFLMWLCELMTYRFQQSYVSEHPSSEVNGIKLVYQKNINELDDTNVNTESEVLSIGVNISELVLAPNNSACDSIFVLAPLFKLVSVLHNQRYQYSLEVINALLGCSIILPSFFDDANYLAIFDNYNEELQKQILNIYFHTVNWMRVTVCAFASQKHGATRKRVLHRLADLICIEQRIKQLLMHAPVGYVPPPCQFLNISKQLATQQGVREKRSSNKAKAITNETILEDELSVNQTKLGNMTIKLGSCKTNKCKINFDQLYGPMESFRQLDVGIIVLLKEEPFTLNYPMEAEEIGTHLGLLELRFILTDLVHKLGTIVNGQQDVSEADTLRSHVAKPEHFMYDLQECLGEINLHLIAMAECVDEQLEKVNHLHSNLDLFKDRFNYIKSCFGLCIHLFALYFSWSEWTDKSQLQLLQSSLHNVLPVDQRKTVKKSSIARVASQVFDYFLKYEKTVLVLDTAVHLHNLLRSLRRLSSTGRNAAQIGLQQSENIRKMCTAMLRRKWYHYTGALEKGVLCNIHLDELVKAFLKDSTFERQTDILKGIYEECVMLNKKDKALDSFPNIKKANFPLLFRGLCEILISTLSAQYNSDNGGDRFKLWESTVRLLNGLLNVVKKVEQPRNFALFLKHSQLYLKLLLQHGLPVLETIVRDSPERLTNFLHELQNVTKFLHNLCCHSKTIKNTAIISYIPSLREILETLLFRVKALLAANKCHAAFHISILDNKDLHGDAIVTPTGSFATSESNSDEEIPEDDASVDETIMDEDCSTTNALRSVRRSTISRSKSSSRSKCF